MQLKNICDYLESIAPIQYQESYDNSGLIVGDTGIDIHKALISLDCTEDVIDEAIEIGANLIISHHPIVFSGLKKFNGKNYVERVVMKAIKHDIALYAIHTNLDNVKNGVNYKIAEKLGLRNIKILDPKQSLLSKLVTFAPHTHAGNIRDALFKAGAGHIGNYSECSFNAEGYGTFKGNDLTNAFVGEKNQRHQEPETRIEVLFPSRLESSLVSALKSAHPYEEVAYDIVQLSNEHQEVGSGIIAEFENELSEVEFLKTISQKLHLQLIRHTELLNRSIKRVAICGGSGSFLLKNAISKAADAFITADYKYHQFFDSEGRILICDVGHYESEQFTIELLLEKITKKFPTFAVCSTKCNTNPVKYFIA